MDTSTTEPAGAAESSNMGSVLCRNVARANAVRRKPKIPKGTKDFLPLEMAIRQSMFDRIENVFRRHGAVTIDTPVFELRETLTGKYGEDSKLIYDLADQGGEMLSLRYDLTVPFARYVAMNAVGRIKRYHLGKVYRRDNPQLNRGRFREFCQCDFDIAGAYPHMVADAEVIKVLDEILADLARPPLCLGEYTIKLNHRRLLDAIMGICGVPPARFRPICSAIDKLDKSPWAEVRREMVDEKGLTGDVADRIGAFVQLKGAPVEMLARMRATPEFAGNDDAAAALADLDELFNLLDTMGALTRVSFDLSLARGLDYYTGVIYEAVLLSRVQDDSGAEASVGSVAAGGRYDGLVGMYSGKDIPAVGVSVGVERVFAIVEGRLLAAAREKGRPIRVTRTQVLVGSIGKGWQAERMRICSELWAANIPAEFGAKKDLNFKKDMIGVCQDEGIPFLLFFGEDEHRRGEVKLKDIAAIEEVIVPRAQLVEELTKRIAARPFSIF